MKKVLMKSLLTIAILLVSVSNIFGQIDFEDVTKKADLLEPLKGMAGHNAVWGDIDNNGYPDLLVGNFTHFYDTAYRKRGHIGGIEPNKLFLNNGDGTFEEVLDSPVRVKGKNSGGVFADFDNDGDLDLMLSHQSHLKVWPGDLPKSAIQKNTFYENDGTGKLIDISEKTGLVFEYPFLGRNTFVLDYDGDGLIDLFLQEDQVLGDISGGNSRLMKNMGNLTFEDVTAEAGFPTGFRQGLHGLGGAVDDMNGDSWPDVFFGHSCRLFINNQDGSFHEVKKQFVDPKFTVTAPDNHDWAGGAATGDLDNDGDIDLVTGSHFKWEGDYHRIYVFLNEGNDENGDPIFREITEEAQVKNPSMRLIHIQIEDIDNDGKMDIATSTCKDFIYGNKGVVNGIPMFEEPIGSGYECGIGYWPGGPFVDYDRDGRLDFFGPEWEPSVASPLLRNVTKGAADYISIQIQLNKGNNRNGIGAKIEVFEEGGLGNLKKRLSTHMISLANGYSCAYEAIAHLGLPNNKKVDIRVSMPCDGEIYDHKSVDRNQLYIVR